MLGVQSGVAPVIVEMKYSVGIVRRILFATLVVCAGCGADLESTEQKPVSLSLGTHIFLIPEANALVGKQFFWMDWLKGADEASRTKEIVFFGDELSKAVPGYRTDSVNLFATLAVLNDDEISRYKNSDRYRDIWAGEGAFQGGSVEAWGDVKGWYKVFRPLEQNSWTVMRRYPDPAISVPKNPEEFWVAHCSKMGTKSKVPVNCRSYLFFDDIAVDFSISEANLPLIDKVRTFLKGRVLEWKRPK